MKKSIIISVFAFFLFAFSSFASDLPRFVDVAELLTEEEGETVLQALDSISDDLCFDVMVVTMDSIDGADVEEFSVWLWEHYGFGFGDTNEGIMLAVVMDTRDWLITAFGSGQDIFTWTIRESIGDEIVPYLKDGDYYSAFITYINEVNDYVTSWDKENGYVPGQGYSSRKAAYSLSTSLVISLGLGAIVGWIVVKINKNKLKSVAPNPTAAEYVVADSLVLTESRERFLYRTVSRTVRQSSSSRSGGGGGRGGSSGHSSSGGKF